MSRALPRGIVPVLQTPFTADCALDRDSLVNLIEAALREGAAGFLVPAVASEVDYLTELERDEIVRLVAATNKGRVPLIIGASHQDASQCRHFARQAEQAQADAYLVAVPAPLYARTEEIPSFFQSIAAGIPLPIIIQDLQWNGPGLQVSTIVQLKEQVPSLAGIKIETVPAGPNYTAVRSALGPDFFIAGGWAVPQMIEALDRGVDALIPEASMVAVYAAITHAHAGGDRPEAISLFRRLVPLLTFANQEIGLSIAFFKRLLVRRGVFRSSTMRQPWAGWDEFNLRIADELIEVYLGLEKQNVLKSIARKGSPGVSTSQIST